MIRWLLMLGARALDRALTYCKYRYQNKKSTAGPTNEFSQFEPKRGAKKIDVDGRSFFVREPITEVRNVVQDRHVLIQETGGSIFRDWVFNRPPVTEDELQDAADNYLKSLKGWGKYPIARPAEQQLSRLERVAIYRLFRISPKPENVKSITPFADQ